MKAIEKSWNLFQKLDQKNRFQSIKFHKETQTHFGYKSEEISKILWQRFSMWVCQRCLLYASYMKSFFPCGFYDTKFNIFHHVATKGFNKKIPSQENCFFGEISKLNIWGRIFEEFLICIICSNLKKPVRFLHQNLTKVKK